MNDPRKWNVYGKGDEVVLAGGPWDGEPHCLTEQDVERVWYAVPSSQIPPQTRTPNFDAAFGIPTPEPCAGYYRPHAPGDLTWHWFKPGGSTTLPYIGYYPSTLP